MKNNYLVSVFCLLGSIVSLGQLEIFPIYSDVEVDPNRRARTSAIDDTLQLPFIENFVSLSTNSNWIKNNGVYVNNHFGRNQPSVGVATLDGVDGTGTPYVFSPNKSSASGIGDYMESKFIDLSSVKKEDGVALSFFWQQGTPHDINRNPLWSRGEQLRIYFMSNQNSYELVWPTTEIVNRIIANGIVKDTFYLENILLDPMFFHKGFQMKFEYNGTLVGNYGIFNVDNMYLDKGIAKFGSDTTYKIPEDYAFSQSPSKLLKEYSSLPIDHFKAASSDIISDSITSTMYSLDKQFITDTDSSIVIKDRESGQILLKSDSKSFGFNDEFGKKPLVSLSWKIDPVEVKSKMESVLTINESFFETTLSVLTPDSIYETNTATSVTKLANYYAYDDGTIEAGLGVRGVGEFVQAFDFIKSDSISGFYVYFPKYGLNLENTFITFNIYKTLKGIDGHTTDSLQYYQNGVVEYATDSISTLNKFVKIPFSKVQPVNSGRYYFGMSQDSDNRVLIGLDYSNDRSNDIFFRQFDDPWSSFKSNNGYGCAAIRPIVASQILGFSDLDESLKLYAFPNPSTGILNFSGDIDQITILNTLGVIVLQTSLETQELNISDLERGIYFIKMAVDDKVSTQTILLN
jgi:hypothetical protein